MINPRPAIIKGLATALDGLVYDSQEVPVYSASPLKATAKPYIQLGTLTVVEGGCKQGFGHSCTIDIQVIDNTANNRVSPKATEEITSLVLTALRPTKLNVISLSEFAMINLTMSNSFQDMGMFETDRYYRNVLQFTFEVYEVSVSNWILATGNWNDSGLWIDTEVWID